MEEKKVKNGARGSREGAKRQRAMKSTFIHADSSNYHVYNPWIFEHRAGLAKIRTHSTTWQFFLTIFMRRTKYANSVPFSRS